MILSFGVQVCKCIGARYDMRNSRGYVDKTGSCVFTNKYKRRMNLLQTLFLHITMHYENQNYT